MKEISDVLNSTLGISGIYLLLLAIITYIVEQGFKIYFEWRKNRKEIVFSKLHEKRAVVLGELFEKLQLLNNAAYDFTQNHLFYEGENPDEIKQERGKVLDKSLMDTYFYFICKKVFLPEKLCKQIECVIVDYRSSLAQYVYLQSVFTGKNLGNCDWKQLVEERVELSKHIRDDLPDLIKEVEREFRQILSSAQKG